MHYVVPRATVPHTHYAHATEP